MYVHTPGRIRLGRPVGGAATVPPRGQHVIVYCDRPASVPHLRKSAEPAVASVAHDRRIARVDSAFFPIPSRKT